MRLTIRLFGAFRSMGASIECDVNPGTTIKDLKNFLVKERGFDSNLLSDSAIACEEEIVQEDFVLKGDCQLAVLPPVCGG